MNNDFTNEKFTFDDILLVPDYTGEDNDIIQTPGSCCLFDFNMSLPIISSPMDTITEEAMMDILYVGKAIGVHHRYCDFSSLYHATTHCFGGIAISPSTGVDRVVELYNGNKSNFFVIDVAHGHTKKVLDFCKNLISNGINKIVSGNVVTMYAVEDYLKIGINHVRVGIGPGSRCMTRTVTGFGVPQGSAINDIWIQSVEREYNNDIVIISDGGCKNTGDIIKAYACGADFVMSGYLFAGTTQCPRKSSDGSYEYRGMASKEALETRKKDFFVEGDSISVSPKGCACDVLEKINSAIIQACHYGGVAHYKELVYTKRIRVTGNSYTEGLTRK
jgi:IMP dehydrogenase